MPSRELRGRWAVVTGASSGLGVDFARALAELGANLLIVARREERLEELAVDLEARHGVSVHVVAMNLARRDAAEELYQRTVELDIDVDVLVNNAGFGLYGDFVTQSPERLRELLQLDVLTLTELTRHFVEGMVARGYGRILQVGSIAAYQGSPGYAVYGAAKSYVLCFSEALNRELRGTGVTCTALSPGITATEFLEVSGQKKSLYQRLYMMESTRVARIGIEAMLKGRSSIISGLGNAANTWILRFLPRRVATELALQSNKIGANWAK